MRQLLPERVYVLKKIGLFGEAFLFACSNHILAFPGRGGKSSDFRDDLTKEDKTQIAGDPSGRPHT